MISGTFASRASRTKGSSRDESKTAWVWMNRAPAWSLRRIFSNCGSTGDALGFTAAPGQRRAGASKGFPFRSVPPLSFPSVSSNETESRSKHALASG